MTYLQTTTNKYHAQSQTYNNITYHSRFEAGYARMLDLSVKAKQIKSWERQVKLDLKVNGQHITNYYIDFIVTHLDDSREFVECKGMELDLWKLKWRILEATFDDFKENPDDRLTVVKQNSWGPPQMRR